MKRLLLLLFCLCCLAERALNAAEPVAVVELFTSEGCSSCPAADRYLKGLVQHAQDYEQKIIPLSFHVDYWNYLGWEDRFSQAAFSRYQRLYGQAFHLRSIYTPQMIVNGQEQFVGSNVAQGNAAIKTALSHPAPLDVTATVVAMDDSDRRIRYWLSELIPDTFLNVVICQKNASSDVLRGENAGLQLTHAHVVRAFYQQDLLVKEGEIRFESRVDFPDDGFIVVYVQKKGSMHILGAAIAGRAS